MMGIGAAKNNTKTNNSMRKLTVDLTTSLNSHPKAPRDHDDRSF